MARPLDYRNGGQCPRCGRHVKPLHELWRVLVEAPADARAVGAHDYPPPKDPTGDNARAVALGFLDGTCEIVARQIACYARTCGDSAEARARNVADVLMRFDRDAIGRDTPAGDVATATAEGMLHALGRRGGES
jgi:hypothetical protein